MRILTLIAGFSAIVFGTRRMDDSDVQKNTNIWGEGEREMGEGGIRKWMV